MIIFNKIRWKNFLSTGNQFTELSLDASSSTLIQGSNGAGKSTILDALCFVLFNKPFRKINKPQLVNSINEKECVVEIEFTLGKTKWKIHRGIKPNRFEIFRDDKLVDQVAATTDQQKWLEQQVLKMNYKSFTQVVILGSSTFVPFMQLTPAHRREVIEDILDIQVFSTMNIILKDRLRSVYEVQKECGYALKSLQEKLTLQTDHIRDSQVTNDSEIISKQKEFSLYEEEIFDFKRQITILECENLDIETELIELIDIKNSIKNKTSILNKIKHRHELATKEINFFHDNDTCPTCTQSIDKIFQDDKVSKLLSNSVMFEDATTRLGQQLSDMDKKLSLLLIREEVMKKNYAEIKYLNTMISRNEKTISKIYSEIERLSVSPDIAKMQGKLEVYQEEFGKMEKHCNEVSIQKNELDFISSLLKDSGIKTQIIKKYIPVINKLINKHLTSMDFYINFTLDEEFSEIIKSRYRDEFSYASFSEGEKQKIDLSLLFTWREIAKMKSSVSTNLLILDEVFDSSLDTSGTEELMKILKNLDNSTNAIVISHKGDVLIDKFDTNIKFDKISDFSKIVELV